MKIVITKKGVFEMFFEVQRFLMDKHHLDIQGSGYIHKAFSIAKNVSESQMRKLSDFICKNILEHNCLLIDYDESKDSVTLYLDLKFRNYEQSWTKTTQHIFFFESDDECKS